MSKAIHKNFVDIAKRLSPALEEAIQTPGPVQLRQRNDAPLAEVLCRAVAGQQLSVKAARSIWDRVVQTAKDAPLVEHLAATRPESLRRCGLSNSKVKAIKAIVDADVAGILDVSELRKLDHDDRSVRLTSIFGVGQWTADMMGISYFGDRDIWPSSDITVWKTLERLTGRRRKTTRTAAHFAPYRTYLAIYMWKIADAAPGIALTTNGDGFESHVHLSHAESIHRQPIAQTGDQTRDCERSR